jgi:HPt (histidine-containing phosphotransfer) domain-containing protein
MQVPVELKLKYLSRRIAEIRSLRELLDSGDFSLALKLGHQVKGNAETFEFPQIAPLGVAIEEAARCRDKEQVRSYAERMEQEILAVRSRLEASPVPAQGAYL